MFFFKWKIIRARFSSANLDFQSQLDLIIIILDLIIISCVSDATVQKEKKLNSVILPDCWIIPFAVKLLEAEGTNFVFIIKVSLENSIFQLFQHFSSKIDFPDFQIFVFFTLFIYYEKSNFEVSSDQR